MCIAMGWPPAAPTDGITRQLERIRSRAARPLMHSDMHEENGELERIRRIWA